MRICVGLEDRNSFFGFVISKAHLRLIVLVKLCKLCSSTSASYRPQSFQHLRLCDPEKWQNGDLLDRQCILTKNRIERLQNLPNPSQRIFAKNSHVVLEISWYHVEFKANLKELWWKCNKIFFQKNSTTYNSFSFQIIMFFFNIFL